MVFASTLCTLELAAAQAPAFDVSYLWHSQVSAVRAYQKRVARVLGPAVTKHLIVVQNGKLVGLIYQRQGDHAGAIRAAAEHSKLLRANKLEPAAAVRRAQWRRITAAERASTPPQVVVNVRKKSTNSSSPTAPTKQPSARKISLEQAIEQHIKQLRRQRRIARNERTAWSVYDFSSSEKLVTINENVPLQAASLIKPFVAAAYLERSERGKLRYTARAKSHMERMIQRSDNGATNWLARKIGGPRRVERLLKQRYPGVFQQTRLVEYIPRNGRTYKNRASAHDYSRFLYAMWNARLAGSDELKRLMALPGPDRVRSRATRVPRSANIYNKTGSTSRLCGDIGIVEIRDRKGRKFPYTFVGIIEKQQRARNYGSWIRSRSVVIGEISDLVYTYVAKLHGISG